MWHKGMVLSPVSNIKDIYSQVCNLLHVTRWTFISETKRHIFLVFHCQCVKIVAKKADCMWVNMTTLIPRQRKYSSNGKCIQGWEMNNSIKIKHTAQRIQVTVIQQHIHFFQSFLEPPSLRVGPSSSQFKLIQLSCQTNTLLHSLQ